jgi:hypothetical protein
MVEIFRRTVVQHVQIVNTSISHSQKILTTSILYDLRSTVTSAAAMGEDDAFAEFIPRLTMKRA